jgi:hypothetical protein
LNQQKTRLTVKRTSETQAASPMAHSICKGPVEGVLIVDGRPQVERADMPCFSFESILAIQRFNLTQAKD